MSRNPKDRKPPAVNAADKFLDSDLTLMSDYSGEESDVAEVESVAPPSATSKSTTASQMSQSMDSTVAAMTQMSVRPKKPTKAQMSHERRKEEVLTFLSYKHHVTAKSDYSDILTAMEKITRRAETIFRRNKSVTKDDKADILMDQDALQQLVLMLQEKSLESAKQARELMSGPNIKAAMSEMDALMAKVCVKKSEMSTQTDPMPETSAPEVHVCDVQTCVREEFEKLREELKRPDPAPVSYASAVKSAVRTPAIKVKVPQDPTRTSPGVRGLQSADSQRRPGQLAQRSVLPRHGLRTSKSPDHLEQQSPSRV